MKLLEFAKVVEPLIGQELTDIQYSHFEGSHAPPVLPFAAYIELDPEFFRAEDINWYQDLPIRFELYTKTKDLTLEKKVEELFQPYVWERMATQWLDSEDCYLIVFYVY